MNDTFALGLYSNIILFQNCFILKQDKIKYYIYIRIIENYVPWMFVYGNVAKRQKMQMFFYVAIGFYGFNESVKLKR